jgi:hypothetical protein
MRRVTSVTQNRIYSTSNVGFWSRYGERTVARLHLKRGATVLDVACGTGASALPAAAAVGPSGRVVGVDLAENLLTRLDGYTWHGNRQTFASRLVMAGVDLRSVQEMGGWKTLKMVARYAHLSPTHLHAAVERLVAKPATVQPSQLGAQATELERNLNGEMSPKAGVR